MRLILGDTLPVAAQSCFHRRGVGGKREGVVHDAVAGQSSLHRDRVGGGEDRVWCSPVADQSCFHRRRVGGEPGTCAGVASTAAATDPITTRGKSSPVFHHANFQNILIRLLDNALSGGHVVGES